MHPLSKVDFDEIDTFIGEKELLSILEAFAQYRTNQGVDIPQYVS